MTETVLFTPLSGNDPLTIGPFADGTLIQSVWAPNPTVRFKVNIPNGSGGWTLLYQLTEFGGEIVPLGPAGYSQIQIQGDGTGGAAFYVAVSNIQWTPYKEAPVFSIPAIIDMSQIGIFNYQFYGANPSALQATNSTALSSTITAINNGANGGRLWISPGTYTVNANAYQMPPQTKIEGAGNTLSTFLVEGNATFMVLNNTGAPNGTTISDVSIAFDPATSGTSSLALNMAGWASVAFRCNFTNCPQAAKINGLRAGLEGCSINYQQGPSGGGTAATALPMVTMVNPQAFCHNFEFQQKAHTSGGPSGIAGFALGALPLEHAQIDTGHLSDFDYGITYVLGGNTLRGEITNVEAQSEVTGVYMVPAASNNKIFAQTYVGCTFTQGNDSTTVSTQIYIDTNGGANSNVDDINFIGVRVWQAILDGIQIHGGQNINFIGGCSRGNGGSNGSNGLAGVAITGPCGDVTLNGVDLSATYPQAVNLYTQQYAFRIQTSAQIVGNIKLIGCNMEGYGSNNPIAVGTGAFNGGTLLIDKCHGYNDTYGMAQNFSTVGITNVGGITAAGTVGYFGNTRISLTFSSATAITLNGISTGSVAANTVYNTILGPYESIQTSNTPTTTRWSGVW